MKLDTLRKKLDKNLKTRRFRIRKRVSGDQERPRLSLFRGTTSVYAQIINDFEGKTLASISTLEKELKGKVKNNIEGYKEIGKILGERALKNGIKKVVFDRNGRVFHGRLKAFADGAREAGLQF